MGQWDTSLLQEEATGFQLPASAKAKTRESCWLLAPSFRLNQNSQQQPLLATGFQLPATGNTDDRRDAVPISERKFPALFPDLFARAGQNAAKSHCLYDFRGKRRESLLNPCLGREFADFGQNLKNQARNRKKSLINSLVQGISSNRK